LLGKASQNILKGFSVTLPGVFVGALLLTGLRALYRQLTGSYRHLKAQAAGEVRGEK
jgi:hypothetical protein